ncbi:unnamed protein product [Protopolystoma xenopodis]|uniref:Uncharacterized protein n=1 Tax=Protopolystoma xenopodis TaxID=117903 RepID=A0A3S5B1U0_9PLAT|nr:unnamed protein product [Protopolystoma xenopodis]
MLNPVTSEPEKIAPYKEEKLGLVRAQGDKGHVFKSRLRELEKYADPSPAELRCKLDSIESRLAVKEERLMEVELLLEAEGRLVQKLETKASMDR